MSVSQEQKDEIIRLRKQGLLIRQIQKKVGVSQSYIGKICRDVNLITKASTSKGSTLCWKCERALPKRGCEWADKFQPVDGWTAEKTVLKCRQKGDRIYSTDSYHVIDCPKFKVWERSI